VIVVDENVIASQCAQLRAWQIPFRQIGHDLGHQGMDDQEEIIPLLHRLPQPTFFTRDPDFYDRPLCHSSYCLVVLTVRKDETAHYLRRILRHREFNTRAKRMGCVVRVGSVEIVCWKKGSEQEERIRWARHAVRRSRPER
jgi:hypothetical protein